MCPDDVAVHQEALAALAESERMACGTLNGLTARICIVDADGRVLAMNEAWRASVGPCLVEPTTVLEGANYLAAWKRPGFDEYATRLEQGFKHVACGELAAFEMEYCRRSPTKERWFHVRLTRFPGEGPTRVIAAHDNATALRAAERSLQINQFGIDHAPMSIFRVDRRGRVVYVNDTACRTLGYDRDELLTLHVKDISPVVRGDGWECHWKRLVEQSPLTFESEHRAKDGTPMPVEVDAQLVHFDGEPYVFAYVKDIRWRKKAEQQLQLLTNFDSLTGLPNRTLLQDRLREALDAAAKEHRGVAVLHINLDQFKVINDTLGYDGGDAVLADVASRVREAAREAELMGRLDGDNFVVVYSGGPATIDDEVAHLASRILNSFAEPFRAAAGELYVTGSVGVAMYPRDGACAHALLRHANSAVNEAKDAGGNEAHFYTPESNLRARQWFALETHLRTALSQNDLRLEYQPQVDLTTGAIYCVEALLRWDHPELGSISPARIIPLAEQTGLIVGIGEWVLRMACGQAMEWQRRGLPPVRVAVNVSARQMHASDFVGMVRTVLLETGLPAKLLELELTETVLLDDLDKAIRDFRELRSMGVRLALDDFGTGYSSLSYLKRCPVDTVKIDKSFIHDPEATSEEDSITRAVVNMAHALHLTVVAEGVETEGQLALLLAYQCDAIQGHLVSASVPPDRIEEMLRTKRGLSMEKLRLHRRPRTLLIVDDEENILAALRRSLRKAGYRIFTASSAAQGLEILSRNEVDVIVSDQRMPGMNGVEFLRRAKELFPETIRIVLSGFTELQSITDAINEGAIYKFLTKPWDDQQLYEHIDEAFHHKGMADENRRLQQELRAANRDLASVNAELEGVLEGQRKTIEQGETSLNITREALDGVPVALLGIDAEGLVVFSNEEAVRRLGASVAELGGVAIETIAPELRSAIAEHETSPVAVTLLGDPYRVVVRAMGNRSRSHGWLVALFPDEGKHGRD